MHVFFIVFISANQCTSVYHNSVYLCNVHSYMFLHLSVILREFYFCALLRYTLLPLALQPAVGFGLSNNTSPFVPICHQLSPSSHSQHLKISFCFFFSPSFPRVTLHKSLKLKLLQLQLQLQFHKMINL